MGELGAAFYISQRKDPRHVGLEAAVNGNVTVLIEGNTRRSDMEAGGVRPSAGRNQHMRRCNGGAGCLLFQFNPYATLARDTGDLRSGQNLDPILLQDAPDLRRDIFV